MEWKRTVGKTAALITGSLNLFGPTIVMRVARAGFRVVVNYAGSIAKAEKAIAAFSRRQASDRGANLSYDSAGVGRFPTAPPNPGCTR